MPGVTRWCACIDRALLPSNITDWVVITCLCVSASADAPIHFKESLGTLCSSFEYRLHRTVMPFGWCHCALFNELSSTSPEAQY